MSRQSVRLCVWSMVMLLPASAMATDAIGLMTATGPVSIDHRSFPGGSSAIFEGERIDTSAQSKALVTRRGTSITVLENSSVIFGRQTLNLDSGAVVVSSTQGTVTKVDNATITAPPGEAGKFVAKKLNGELQVVALEGRIYVSDGQQETPVPAGSGVKVPPDKDSASPSARRAKGMSWLSDPEIGILIVVVGAIAAGVALGIVNSQNNKAASPSVP